MTDKTDWIETKYFLNGKPHASRLRPYAPAVGDEIKLNDGIYKITFRIWIENGKNMHDFHCAVDMEPIEIEKPKGRKKK